MNSFYYRQKRILDFILIKNVENVYSIFSGCLNMRFNELLRPIKNIWMDRNIKRRKQCKKVMDKRCLNHVYHFAVKRVTSLALAKTLMNLTYVEVNIRRCIFILCFLIACLNFCIRCELIHVEYRYYNNIILL